MFRPLLDHLQALWGKKIQELSIFQCIVGSPNAYRLWYMNVKYMLPVAGTSEY